MADQDDAQPPSSRKNDGAPLAKVISIAGRKRRAPTELRAKPATLRRRVRPAGDLEGSEREADQAARDTEREQQELDERIARAEREIEQGDHAASGKRALLRNLRAIQRFRRGDHDAAFAEWKELIDEDPRQDDVLLTRALFYRCAENLPGAIADYSRAAELWPNRAEVYLGRGRCFMAQKDYDRAKADFLRVTHLRPRDPSAYLYLAKSQRFGGDHGAAVRACGRAIKFAPWRAELYEFRAGCFLSQQLEEAARKDLDRCLELDPKLASALRLRSRLHTSQDKDDRELEDLSRALEIEPNDAGALQSRAYCHTKRGDPYRAIADFSRAIDVKPEESVFRRGRAEAYLKLGAYDDAIRDLTEVIILGRGSVAKAYWLRGHAHRKRGDLKSARDDYEQALWDDDSLLEDLHRSERMNGRLGRTRERMEDLEILLLLHPTDPALLLERAKLHTSQKAYQAALSDLDKGLEVAATWGDDLYHARADVFRELGEFKKAAEDESRAIAIIPYVAEYHAWRGIYRLLSGGPSKEAAADILLSLELKPDSQLMHILRDWYRERAERYEENVQADELADEDGAGADEGALFCS